MVTSAAVPGVYLLSVLPDAEIHRSLGYAIAQRHTSLAAVFPSTDFGRAQRMAFDTVSANLGVKARQSFSFADANDQRRIATEVGGHVSVGNMDAIFLPDRVSAPAFASLLQRVIPQGNDKILKVDRGEFASAVDRVSTISSERGRAVKLALSDGRMVLSVNNPDSGSATEELGVEYPADAIEIGFNARYLLDVAAQLETGTAEFRFADPGSPTLIQDAETPNALYVLMPMRV